MATGRTALVTGASRGIGKAIALALAGDGWDVAITARTVREGESRRDDDLAPAPLPGSLETTAEANGALGRRAVYLPLDLLDRESLVPVAQRAIEELGHVDLLVNNAIFVGPGNHDRFLDIEPGVLEKRLFGNLTAQLLFTQPILRHMVARGRGTILGITSGAGLRPPPAPPGEGGWAIGYGCSKGGFHRMAGHIAVEYGDRGIRALNLQPGPVVTERVQAAGAALEWVRRQGLPPETIGRVVVHLLEEGDRYPNGATIEARDVAQSEDWLG